MPPHNKQKNKYIRKIIIVSLFIVIFGIGFLDINQSIAATRIFYEDCEDTSFNEHFLEDNYGSNTQEYWNDLKTKMSQSNIAHSGNHSMMYNPYVDGNPHTRIGVGNVSYGNLSNFDMSLVNSRYWYFRWYQRWESGTVYAGANKNLYINLQSYGDFWTALEKGGSDSWHYGIKDHDTQTLIANRWISHSGGSVDDENWHKMEYFLDVGTTGAGNGSLWIKVDGILLDELSNITFNNIIHVNPISHVAIPSNASAQSGSQNVWLDDIEIYILNGPTDIPSEIGAAPQCSDSIDNDSDGLTDYPNDTDCTSNIDNDEAASSSSVTYNLSNFISLVTNWLGIGDNNSDVNNDGIVNTRDIGIMMSGWE